MGSGLALRLAASWVRSSDKVVVTEDTEAAAGAGETEVMAVVVGAGEMEGMAVAAGAGEIGGVTGAVVNAYKTVTIAAWEGKEVVYQNQQQGGQQDMEALRLGEARGLFR